MGKSLQRQSWVPGCASHILTALVRWSSREVETTVNEHEYILSSLPHCVSLIFWIFSP